MNVLTLRSTQLIGVSLLKVCCICTFFPPTTGGSETHTFQFVKYLADKGYDVSVIVSRPTKEAIRAQGYDEQTIKKASAEKIVIPGIEQVPIYNITSHGLTRLLHIRQKIREIEKSGPINAFDFHNSFLLPSILFKNRVNILSLHFYELTCPHFGWPQQFMPDHFILDSSNISYSYRKCVIERGCVDTLDYARWRIIRSYALRKVNVVVVKKRNLKYLVLKAGVDHHKVSIIPYWVDAKRIHDKCAELRDKIGVPQVMNSDFVFSFLGRLVPPKGPILLLKAFALVAERFQNVKILYVGDGILRKRIEELSETMGIKDKVILTGNIRHDKIMDYMSISDAFVHSQRYMNYGWALLETMATGKPIVATSVGETTDILTDGYNALLAEPNPEALASRMIDLICSPKLARKLGSNALRTVEKKHSLDNLGRYDALLTECEY